MKNLKITLVAIFFYLFNFFNVFSQCDVWKRDLIHNAGFEDGENNKPSGPAQMKFLDVWESDIDSGTINGAKYYVHSPDWYTQKDLPLLARVS